MDGAAQSAQQLDSRQQEPEDTGFEFQPISVQDPKVFPSFKDAKIQQKFFQWGLKDSMEVAKFRFNRSFNLIGAEEFLRDLFNSK